MKSLVMTTMTADPNHLQEAKRIVGAYLQRNPVPAELLPSVISTVYQALMSLAKPAKAVDVERTPAVPIRRSVQRDFVICLECGWKGRVLRRHLGAVHGLDIDRYRSRWSLSRKHALVAPSYSGRRSITVKQAGLGRFGRRSAAPGTAASGSPTPTHTARRGRLRPLASP